MYEKIKEMKARVKITVNKQKQTVHLLNYSKHQRKSALKPTATQIYTLNFCWLQRCALATLYSLNISATCACVTVSIYRPERY